MKSSKINLIGILQRWMDSVSGQTFLNYAYSWGASIVILGALFKLTHMPLANLMLYIGMGTEVLVFFISAFDRPFEVRNKEEQEDLQEAEEQEKRPISKKLLIELLEHLNGVAYISELEEEIQENA